ncbi:hypothetical protein D2E26_0940 [Bifidobacterium dolichotidis]|uniref:DUF3180 domain-containing protein n=1 Tax=Bifidobacterium dolichotidis TaxID=2306976 RepID=A0A430FPY8_9BIFI|nr:DUF3180 domain-containing protein [Bifidobacterium dolichotidis]RSX54886.1 hypothetical protein D2E26_0940 [Bifidobacterium dolichotidis]
MRSAHRIPWWVYLVAAIIGFVGGILLQKFDEFFAVGVLGAPWFVAIIMVALGIVVICLAWQVHRYTTTEPRKRIELKTISPERAVNTLVLAKALALAGAILLGWYCGQLVMCLGHAEAEYYKRVLFECIIAGSAALIDMVLGIISERLCEIPPAEGPEHPQMSKHSHRPSMRAEQGHHCSA